MNLDWPSWPGFNGLDALATSESGIIPENPSSAFVTPNAWNDFPSLTTLKRISSPTLACMVGLWFGSPGNELNASVLKSDDSTNDKSTDRWTPENAA